MADTLTAPIASGTVLATDEIGGVHYPRTKISFGADGSASDVSPADPLPVDIGAGPFTVTGTVGLDSTALTALETIDLGATSLAALESVTVGGTVELGATSLAALESITATGPLTDTQLRATAVPVSGPLTDTQLRASAFAVTVSGVATAANQATLNTSVASLLTETTFTTRIPTLGAKASSGSVSIVPASDATFPLPTGAATNAKLDEAIAALNEQRGGDKFAAITPADTNLATVPDAIYVGGAGNLVVRGSNGVDATFVVTAGAVLPIRPTQVRAATTATGIVGINN